MKRFMLLLVFLALPAHAQARHWITSDFFVEQAQAPEQLIPQPPVTDCRAHIAQVMCLVDTVPPGQNDRPRPCLPGGAAYAHYFEELYDNFPATLQRVFCSLTVINIERNFFGTAYGGIREDAQGHALGGAIMGIRKSVLDERLDLATWATWKEQLSFGGVTDSYTRTPGLPVIHTHSKPGVSDLLYFVVAHEFGHIFDFANKLNHLVNGNQMAPGSWGALSWKTEVLPTAENQFPNHRGLCFYECKDKSLPRAAIAPLYAALYESTNFISTYSSTEPWDDFADSLAYVLVARNLETRYELDTDQPTRAVYDSIAKVSSARFATKYKYIDAFLRRTDIRYP